MHREDIYRIINKYAPSKFAEKWDCSGVLVESNVVDIKRVLLALTVTEDIIRQAVAKNCDMIISHHPLFYVPLNYRQINIFCAHTNLDRTIGGTTDTLVDILGFKAFKEETNLDLALAPSFVRYVNVDITVRDLFARLREISLNLRMVNLNNVHNLKRIAFCAGSGAEFINEAFQNGADAFVTGDLKFHTALDSKIVLFDIGHFESEIGVLDILKSLLEKNVEVIKAEEHSPFIYNY